MRLKVKSAPPPSLVRYAVARSSTMYRLLLICAAILCAVARAQDSPQNLRATTISSTSIHLTWDPPVDSVQIVNYDVEYNQSTFTEIPEYYSDATRDLETGILLDNLQEYVEYSIMVRVHSDGLIFLTFSPILHVTTLQDAPSAPPTSLSVAATSSTWLFLTWQPPSAIDINGLLAHYIIRYWTIPSSVSVISVSGNTPSRNISGLDAFSQYTVQVAAFTVSMGPNAVVTATTSEDVPKAPPTIIQGYSNSPTVIVVEWEPPAPELLRGILRGYVVLYKPANSSTGGRVDEVEPTQTAHQLVGLQPSNNYSIQVAAVTIDEGPFSSPVYITTQTILVDNACLVISNLQLSSSRSPEFQNSVQVTISWSCEVPFSRASAHKYNLSYSADQTPPYPEERRQTVSTQTAILPGDQTNYTIEGALPFAEYSVVVYAFEGEREGDRVQQTIRSLAIEPSAVTNLLAVATSSQSIQVQWSLPLYPNSPIFQYILYHRAANTIQLPPIDSNGYVQHTVSNSTEYTLTDLQSFTTFAIHVQAVGKTLDLEGRLIGPVVQEILVRTSDPTQSEPESSSSTGTIVGGVVGGIVAVSIIAAVTAIALVYLCQRHKRAKFKLAYFARERQGPSALTGTTMMSNPVAFDMEDCAAYIPSRAQEAGGRYGDLVGGEDEGLVQSNNPAYINVATTQRHPVARPHSLLDDDGYDVIRF